MKRIVSSLLSLLLAATLLPSCSEEGPRGDTTPDSDRGLALDDGTAPAFSQSIVQWTGQTATDASLDLPGSDSDFYHELSTFDKKVTIEFDGATATVTTPTPLIRTHTEGAYVTVDFQTAAIGGVEIIVRGSTTDGGLKIYGANKFLLTFDGADIASRRGSAINNQCKKRVFVRLSPGSVNRLADCADYLPDPYYRADGSVDTEDRKGCFFSEGNMIFSGSGTLEVKGRSRHGIATDGYLVTRPGVTIAVTEAAKNCIHVKGDASDSIGLWMKGGYIYALATAEAAKAIKTDQSIRIDGGTMTLNTTGDGAFDPETDDTSSAACLKSDTFIEITGGNLALRSTGFGAKGINAGTSLKIAGGSIGVSCTGEKYIYSDLLTASAKAIKATERIDISAGSLTVLSTGRSDGSRGIESDAAIDISGGAIEIYAYDDAINAPSVAISGNTATVSAFSIAEDAIKGKQRIDISGGSLTATAGSYPAQALSCNDLSGVRIIGATVIAAGGAEPTLPASGYYRLWTGLTAPCSASMSVKRDSNELYSFTLTRGFEGATLLVAGNIFTAPGAIDLYCDGRLIQ